MKKIEVLIGVLEKNGFSGIRSEIQEKEEEITRSSRIGTILNAAEVAVVKKVLKEYKIPSPTGWAHTMWIHMISEDVKNFSPNNFYDYTELCNLCTTLHQAGLADREIWRKLDTAKDTLSRYG